MTRLIRASLILAIAGIVMVIPVLIQENPITFVVFSFLGQPLLLLSFGLYLISVLGELKKSGIFGGG